MDIDKFLDSLKPPVPEPTTFEQIKSFFGGVWDLLTEYWFPVGLLVLLFFGIGAMVRYETSPGFTLKKDEWTCTKQELRNTVRTVNTFSFDGKVGMAAVPTTEAVCVEYRRVK